jgi:hypothetical protein
MIQEVVTTRDLRIGTIDPQDQSRHLIVIARDLTQGKKFFKKDGRVIANPG